VRIAVERDEPSAEADRDGRRGHQRPSGDLRSEAIGRGRRRRSYRFEMEHQLLLDAGHRVEGTPRGTEAGSTQLDDVAPGRELEARRRLPTRLAVDEDRRPSRP